MKVVLYGLQILSSLVFLTSCATVTSHSETKLTDLSEEQKDFMNREALSIASKRLEEMVTVAKSRNSSVDYLASDLFLKANMSLLEGDYTTAAELFKHVANLVPEDQFVQKKYAISLIRTGNLELSQTVLEKLYTQGADEKIGLILAGIYTSVDQEEKARDLYAQILRANPQSEDACIFLSKSLAVAKKTEPAIRQLRRCAESDKKNGMYDYYIGKLYLDLNQVKKASAAFRKAHERQPSLGQAVNALGILLEESDKLEEAIELYVRFLEKHPTDEVILNSAIQALFSRERYEEVIPYAERLSDLEPENMNLKVKLGILYTDTKRYPEAISMFKALLSVAPESDKILYYLGAIHQEMNDYQRSIEYFNQIPTSSGLYTDSSVQMANMLSTLAQAEFHAGTGTTWREAFLALINKRIDEFKDLRVEFSIIKAGFFEGTNRFRDAMETVMVVQDEKAFSTQHKYYLANLYEKEKRFEESTALIMGILEVEPKNAHAWNFLGYSLLVRGTEMEKAHEYIQTAMKISPEDGYIRDSLGWLYFKQGKIQKALAELKLAHKFVPDDVEILKHLAIVHKELKEYSKARGYFESALRFARYQADRDEINSMLADIDTDRVPASGVKD